MQCHANASAAVSAAGWLTTQEDRDTLSLSLSESCQNNFETLCMEQ
jgi:hypothetical protein